MCLALPFARARLCADADHYHLLLESLEPNLSRPMQWLNVSYSVWYNRRHGRSGHLFQGRFKAIVLDAEESGVLPCRHGAGLHARNMKRADEWDSPECLNHKEIAVHAG